MNRARQLGPTPTARYALFELLDGGQHCHAELESLKKQLEPEVGRSDRKHGLLWLFKEGDVGNQLEVR